MNRLCFLVPGIVYLWLMCLSLLAQQGTNSLPPQPPFLSEAPAYSTWVIKFTPRQGNAVSAAFPRVSTSNYLKEIHVTKMDKDHQEIQYWSDGSTLEKWEFHGLLLFEQPSLSNIHILSLNNLPPLMREAFFDHSKSDFPDLDWLSADSYVGMKTFQGQTCYWFQVKSSTVSTHSATSSGIPSVKVQAVPQAWINAQTRLPVAVDDGVTLHIYTFGDETSRQAELPPRFAEALEKYQKELKQSRRSEMHL
jgi:hypothetical protein